MQEWAKVDVREREIRIDLCGGSINIAKRYSGDKVKPVEVRWASLYDHSLETAQRFAHWLNLALGIAESVEYAFEIPKDFERVAGIERIKGRTIIIADLDKIRILVPDDWQLVE